MAALQKLQLAVVFASLAILAPGGTLVGALPAAAEENGLLPPAAPPGAPMPDVSGEVHADPRANARERDPVEKLLAELAEPGRKDWERLQSEIVRIWSRSGSPAMDLLLERGHKAMAEENYPKAVEHLSALIDHAPDFAEGWNARATAYFLEGNFGLAIADVEHVLVLNPRHFGALTGLASMFEAMDLPGEALSALRMAEKLNPNRPDIKDGIARLEKEAGEVEL